MYSLTSTVCHMWMSSNCSLAVHYKEHHVLLSVLNLLRFTVVALFLCWKWTICINSVSHVRCLSCRQKCVLILCFLPKEVLINERQSPEYYLRRITDSEYDLQEQTWLLLVRGKCLGNCSSCRVRREHVKTTRGEASQKPNSGKGRGEEEL